MGNKGTKVTSSDFNQKDWQVTDRQTSQNQAKGNYKVLENSRTGQLVDQYELFWPSEQDFLFYLDSYNWRKQQYNIVQSRFIVEQHHQQFCSKSFAAKVYIEHIQTRLSDVTDIPYPDNLYVVVSALEGYQKLYENVHHYFPITQDQICVDKEGLVKVWVNSDLSKNYPQTDLYVNNEHKDQSHMVQQILSLIWQNTDQQSEPASFRQFYQKKKGKKRIGFDQAKVIVNQYAKINSSPIPQTFISILQMRQQSQEEYADQTRNQHHEDNMHLMNGEQHQEDGQYQYQGQYMPQYDNYGINGQYQDVNMNNQMVVNHMIGHQQQQQNVVHPEYNYQYQTQISPSQTTHTFYPINNQPNVINHHYNNVHYVNMPIPSPHPINQPFIPRVVGAQTGPIISIPPIRGGHFIHQAQPHQVIYNSPTIQRSGYQTNQIRQNGQAVTSTLTKINEQRPESHYYSNIQGQGYFANQNQPFQQRVSTLNQNIQDYNSQQHRYSQQPTYNIHTQYHEQYDQFNQLPQKTTQKYNNNSPVNRSLQLLNKSDKKISQRQQLKVNKSHINEFFSKDGQPLQPNILNYEEQQSYNNSRHSGIQSGSRHEQNKTQRSQLNQLNQYEMVQNQHYMQHDINMYDTKYYTLDTQVELDEQIAADLKKFILAS